MNTKLTFVVYPAVAILSLAAAFSAHAQRVNDATDQAAYGATVITSPAGTAGVKEDVKTALVAARNLRDNDPTDHAAYGATATPRAFVLSRAEVRAEAVAARDGGYEALVREGADPQYAVLQRAKTATGLRMLAGTPASKAQ